MKSQAAEIAAFSTWHRPCIVLLGSFCPPEANLSSHLSISYSAAATASGSTASAAGTATAGGKPAAGANTPAGFLSALIDQLLAGGAIKPADGAATPTDDSTPAIPQLINIGLGAPTDATAKTSPQTNVLLTKLADQIKALKAKLDKGEQPDPGQLKQLGDTAEALAALITTPSSQATATPASPMTLDPLKTLKSVTATGSDKPQSDIPGTGSDKPNADNQPSDQVTQFLANLGITLSPTGTPTVASSGAKKTSVSAAGTAKPLPGIAQLASQLSDLSQAIAPAAPEVAAQLDVLTKKLDAAETDPSVLAQLSGGSDASTSDLDRIVQSLLAAKPTNVVPSTPQLASTAQLQVPAPITLRPATTPAADTSATTIPPIAASAAPALKLQVAAKTNTDAPAKDDGSTADAKIVAAATSQADSKTTNAPAADNSSSAAASAAVVPGAASAARALPAAYQTATNPINMTQVAFEMVRQMHQGQSRFTIRIDPPELGRVDVKMHVDASGNVNARLTVERSETLDMFQRDKGSLEKALTQAGVDGAKTNLEFSLKQNPFAGMSGGDQRPSNGNANGSRFSLASADDDDSISAAPSVTLYRGVASSGGINLFV